jgi:choline dehydrogenase-like flavoprotein
MVSETLSYDVIIVGSGAGGGTLAWALADSGKRVLLIERGDYVPRELENWSPRAVHLERKYSSVESWRTYDGRSFRASRYYCVGGSTKFYGAALFRLRERDFGELAHWGGLSPAWPISYKDFEPYYLQAEKLYQVHGRRKEDPTEPWSSGPYAWDAVPHEPRISELHEDWTRYGLKPFHVPLGIMLNGFDQAEHCCVRCSTCDGYPCRLYAKADAQIICVDVALTHPNVSLLTNAKVYRLETAPDGREVSRVLVEHLGQQLAFRGDIVVLSCGAINSPQLLLASRNEKHPRGLANGSGVVGRYLMLHNNSILLALTRSRNLSVFQKTIALNDFYFNSSDWNYPMGHISLMGKMSEEIFSVAISNSALRAVPFLSTVDVLDFWLISEDLPDANNRLTVNSDGEIVIRYRPNNLYAHERLISKLENMLSSINCVRSARLPMGLGGTGHHLGTIRFGKDSRSSALDINCKAHEIENLYVVDGSFFPSSGAINPALTIMANALRVAEQLRYKLD